MTLERWLRFLVLWCIDALDDVPQTHPLRRALDRCYPGMNPFDVLFVGTIIDAYQEHIWTRFAVNVIEVRKLTGKDKRHV